MKGSLKACVPLWSLIIRQPLTEGQENVSLINKIYLLTKLDHEKKRKKNYITMVKWKLFRILSYIISIILVYQLPSPPSN